MKKKPQKKGVQHWSKKVDQVFSRWIRAKSADRNGLVKCFTCDHSGDIKTMQCGHYVPRQYKATRWCEDNCKPQCYACNMFYGGQPQTFRENLIKLLGETRVLEIESDRHSVVKRSVDELIDLYRFYDHLAIKLSLVRQHSLTHEQK